MAKLIMARSLRAGMAAALLLVAGVANAQWMWMDAQGKRQVSNQPPPASVPQKNILKSPSGTVTPAPAAPAEARGPSLAERDAEFRKRQQDKAEQEAKAMEAAAVNGKLAQECQLVRASKAKLDSGVRVVSGPGRAEFMSDQERAALSAQAAKTLAENCQ